LTNITKHDRDAEYSILNCLYRTEIIENLNPEWFYCSIPRAILTQARAFLASGSSFTIDDLTCALSYTKDAKIDLQMELTDIPNIEPVIALDRIAKDYKFRKFYEIVEKSKTDESIESAINDMALIESGNYEFKEFTMTELSQRAIARWNVPIKDRIIYKTGIEKLDKYIRVSSGIVYIIAPPKTCKSWLLINFAAYACKVARYLPCIISAEMSADALYSRISSNVSGVDVSSFDYNEYGANKNDLEAYSNSILEIDKLNLKIYEAHGINYNSLSTLIKRVCNRKYNPIFIDYLQLIHEPNAKDLRTSVTRVSGLLRDMAKQYNKIIVCLSQAGRVSESKTGEKKKEKQTEIYHAKESGAIEADAEALITLTDISDRNNMMSDSSEIKIGLTQRNGISGKVKVFINKATGRITEES
jgi:replicative DNA helicase